MPDEWYFSRGGTERQGPITLHDLHAKSDSGELSATDLVWHAGMPQWVAAATIPELVFPPAQTPATPTAQPVQSIPLGTVNYSQPHPDATITCSARTIDLLRQTRPWARIIAVSIFTLAGLTILGGLGLMASAAFGARDAFPAIAGIIYIAISALYFAPAIYLNRYCSRITQVVALRRDDLLEQAVEAQKSFWKFCGVFALFAIGVNAVILLVMVLAFAFR